MKVKMILPALVEALGLPMRPIKYSLFPPLGLATLASYLPPDVEVSLQDEHVEKLDLEDSPNLVVIQVYITSAKRSYEIADLYRKRGIYVCLGGLHVTSCPSEAMPHADTIFFGPGEDTWPAFLEDFREGHPKVFYASVNRCLKDLPLPRRDLIKRKRYLVPNSMVFSRGCPHHCSFCYKDAFFRGGHSYYTLEVDRALREMDDLSGKHLFFLDDHLFGHPKTVGALFDGMKGMGRLWQAGGTVQTILTHPELMEKAAASGLRSLFVGFETINPDNLAQVSKNHNMGRDYNEAVRRLHHLGVMVNGSFVFGMDEDGPDVFDRTTDWAVQQGLETATFHILTPYPGTPLRDAMEKQGRILTNDWDLYDTRHTVFRPAKLSPRELESGYWRAYQRFYSWKGIFKAALTKPNLRGVIRHLALTGAWKKMEPFWNLIIKTGVLGQMRPVLEGVLNEFRSGNKGPRVRMEANHSSRVLPMVPELSPEH